MAQTVVVVGESNVTWRRGRCGGDGAVHTNAAGECCRRAGGTGASSLRPGGDCSDDTSIPRRAVSAADSGTKLRGGGGVGLPYNSASSAAEKPPRSSGCSAGRSIFYETVGSSRRFFDYRERLSESVFIARPTILLLLLLGIARTRRKYQ